MCSCWNWHWKQTTTRLNWRVFPILITLCKYVLCWISMNFWGARINWPIDCGPYNGGSLASRSQAIPEARGGKLPEREIQNSWLGNVAPTNIGFDQRLFDRMNQNESEWTNQRFRFRTETATSTFCNWNVQHLDIKKVPLSFRKTFYDMWIV